LTQVKEDQDWRDRGELFDTGKEVFKVWEEKSPVVVAWHDQRRVSNWIEGGGGRGGLTNGVNNKAGSWETSMRKPLIIEGREKHIKERGPGKVLGKD